MIPIVFIIGNARSGTTWLGKILAASPGFKVTIEQPPIFQMVDRMALHPRTVRTLFPWLVSQYEKMAQRAAPDLYADKSHQNIWLAERLDQAFAGALFLGIERDPYGTVASMIRHEGVLAHFTRWRSYPIPNRHIGIPAEIVDEYESLPLVVKCALRWSAHHWRMQSLKEFLGSRLLLLSYESLVLDADRSRARLSEFLGKEIPPLDPDPRPLKKWEDVLTREQIKRIDRAIAVVDMFWACSPAFDQFDQ